MPCVHGNSFLKRVYTASGLPQAYLLRDFLAAEGIETLVFNEHSAGAVGEIPCNETLPQLWVRNDGSFDRARSLLLAYECEGSGDEPRICPGCGEENPGSFDFCWRCGRVILR